MAVSKNRKNHKQKIKSRNDKIKQDSNRLKKYNEIIMQKIKEESERGDFTNAKPIDEVEGEQLEL